METHSKKRLRLQNDAPGTGLKKIPKRRPRWQFNDDLLSDLCRAGCGLVEYGANVALIDHEKYAVTDEGILDYCFSSELGAMKDRGRRLSVTGDSITPALLEKCLQVSAMSKVTGRVTLAIHDPEEDYVRGDHMAAFDDNIIENSETVVEYDFPDQGNGMRVKVKFIKCGCWEMRMRRANKNDKTVDLYWWSHF